MEDPSIDLGASHMLSERSTIWASPPMLLVCMLKVILRSHLLTKLSNSFRHSRSDLFYIQVRSAMFWLISWYGRRLTAWSNRVSLASLTNKCVWMISSNGLTNCDLINVGICSRDLYVICCLIYSTWVNGCLAAGSATCASGMADAADSWIACRSAWCIERLEKKSFSMSMMTFIIII